jgi:antitoxin VapB
MSLNIKNPRAFKAAHELASATGESLTEAVTVAIEERLRTIRKREREQRLEASVADIQAFVASLPILDSRVPDEILGYDSFGLPS